MIQVLVSIAVAAALGVALALLGAQRAWAIVASVATFCLSILITYWDDMLRSQTDWAKNLVDGILQTGLLSFVCHALPVLLAYGITRWALRRRQTVR